MFDNLDFDKIPIMLLNEDSVTGYIDFITWKRVQRPIVWGYDQFKRKFIIIKCTNQQKQKSIRLGQFKAFTY